MLGMVKKSRCLFSEGEDLILHRLFLDKPNNFFGLNLTKAFQNDTCVNHPKVQLMLVDDLYIALELFIGRWKRLITVKR